MFQFILGRKGYMISNMKLLVFVVILILGISLAAEEEQSALLNALLKKEMEGINADLDVMKKDLEEKSRRETEIVPEPEEAWTGKWFPAKATERPITVVNKTSIPTTMIPTTVVPLTTVPTTAVPLNTVSTTVSETVLTTTTIPTPIPIVPEDKSVTPTTPAPVESEAVTVRIEPEEAWTGKWFPARVTERPITVVNKTTMIPTTVVPLTTVPTTAVPLNTVSTTAVPLTTVSETVLTTTTIPTPIPIVPEDKSVTPTTPAPVESEAVTVRVEPEEAWTGKWFPARVTERPITVVNKTTMIPTTVVPLTTVPTTAVPLNTVSTTAVPLTTVSETVLTTTTIPTPIPIVPEDKSVTPTTPAPVESEAVTVRVEPEEAWTGKWFPARVTERPITVVNKTTMIPTTVVPLTTVPTTAVPLNTVSTTAVPLTTVSETVLTTTTIPIPIPIVPEDKSVTPTTPAPVESEAVTVRVESKESWTGKWFPEEPTVAPSKQPSPAGGGMDGNNMWQMINSTCDDGKQNLTVDWEPDSKDYECEGPFLEPDLTVKAILEQEYIPPAYVARHVCMKSKIPYDQPLPTFGPHRPAWARYGEYTFLPIQRFLHNMEHGAVIMLYHPCTHPALVNKLKKIVKGCLYRHVISASRLVPRDKPLALMTWGWRLLMPTVDTNLAVQFIREHALHGYEKTHRDGFYDQLLVSPAAIVSTPDDQEICPRFKGL